MGIEKKAFYALAVIGFAVCGLTELEKFVPAVQQMCGGAGSGCETVQASPYSSFLGVSLGIWGMLSYAAWAVVYWRDPSLAGLMGGALMGAELFFGWLQLYVIHAICILCMAQFTVVAVANLLLFFTAAPAEKRNRWRMGYVALALAVFAALYVPAKARADQAAAAVESITSWGNPQSKYRMEFFSDYQCPWCKTNEEIERKVMQSYPEIHIVFRDYLISSHAYSPMAVAYAGSVAYFQGKDMYLKTRTELFENQDKIFEYLKGKLPSMRQDKAMEEVVNAKLKADRARADALAINGTPAVALVKDGQVVKVLRGFTPWDKLKYDLDRLTDRPVR